MADALFADFKDTSKIVWIWLLYLYSMVKPMELRHLRYFTAIADAGSLSRASEKLFIAQPPLSVQIRQLEDELGVALFTRHHRGVFLTAAGQSLLPLARDLLDRAARLSEQVRVSALTAGGTVTLGYVPSASSTVIPGLVGQLRANHPAWVLLLREMTSNEQNEALVGGHIDAGIARSAARHPRVGVACEVPDDFCLAMPAETSNPSPGDVSLRNYGDQVFVAFTRHQGPAYFDRSIHLCSQAGFSPRIRYEASTIHGVLDLVAAGLGVALVPASAALLNVKGVRLRRLHRRGTGEVLVLLRRKADTNPLLPFIESVASSVFKGLSQRVDDAMRVAQ